ncbi:MAG: exodeoxyribonuclease V subunit gamma [Lachnospiraceae bacterium]|nr:exodeoxyribonuclease V subunit gamma [Lachnospiraceae bacterium]
MSLQMILGPSGSGKSHYIYNKIIKDGIKNPDINYILLVPEQYSMALQRKLVMLHPAKGTMNIDVIGFNRLCFRVFDELNIKPERVLEDFGKSMLIRKAAGERKGKMSVYSGSLDKSGFIDEVKSLMSEMYQYDISREKLDGVIEKLKDSPADVLLYKKLMDMKEIFGAFDTKLSDNYIAAEKLIEILAENIERSALIKRSIIVMDGFTGFTPIQLGLIEKLIRYSKEVYGVFTIDKIFYDKRNVKEHELFYLTKKTISGLKELAIKNSVDVSEDYFVNGDTFNRWSDGSKNISWLEKNIFRFPYKKCSDSQDDISITVYDTPRKEIEGVAYRIDKLVKEGNYRYKDIAVISGNLEGISSKTKQIFERYDIPYFLDASIPVKNNPYINSIEYLLRIVKENFSYDSVFAFLKAGIIRELDDDDIETIENYVLKKGIRGKSAWSREWNEEVEEIRGYIADILIPFYDLLHKSVNSIKAYTKAIRDFMEVHEYEKRMENYKNLYVKVIQVLEKMDEIMGDDSVDIDDFSELLALGLKDLTLGVIPKTLDMTIIGDITRTRLDDIKVLFIIGINDGIIPKKSNNTGIISDGDKERLKELGIELAPTEKFNSYIEQFYLYINMTKPKDKLILSYTSMNDENEQVRPSYIISRITNIFTGISVDKDDEYKVAGKKTGLDTLIEGMQLIMSGDNSRLSETMSLYKLYRDMQAEDLTLIENAFLYNNIPQKLSDDMAELIKLKLMSQSVSRLEKYASCAYSYFLQYILGLSERKIRQIDNRDIGTILHGAMERMYRHVHDNMDNDWSKIEDNTRDEMVERFVEEAFDEAYDSYTVKEGRFEYLLTVLKRIGKRTAAVLSDITDKDLLRPEYFEYKFTKKLDVPGQNFDMTLNGIVDRGDVYYSPEDKSLRLRIIDYKSGSHDFKISRLYEGLSLQLSVYMNVMQELVENQYNKDKEETEKLKITPEGMYYYKMTDPYVAADDADAADKEREKTLKLTGLLNDDPQKFKDINDFAIYKAKGIAGSIIKGEIDKNPMTVEGKSTCEYCLYKEVCRFDKKYGGNKERLPKYTEKDKDIVYDKIKEVLAETKDGN